MRKSTSKFSKMTNAVLNAGKVTWYSEAPPMTSYAIANIIKSPVKFVIAGEGSTSPVLRCPGGEKSFCGDFAIARALCHSAQATDVYSPDQSIHLSNHRNHHLDVNMWLDFALKRLSGPGVFADGLAVVNLYLQSNTYLVGNQLTLADIGVWSVLRESQFKGDQANFPFLTRWFNLIGGKLISEACRASSQAKRKSKSHIAGLIDPDSMPDFKEKSTNPGGKICTRFPPEPSGYLHVSALLNDYYAHEKYNGSLILRFDDTNPSKEKDEYVENIIIDLKRLGIQPDKVTHTSDSFPLIIDYARKALKAGWCYMDNTDAETMRNQRLEKQPSEQRNRSHQENLELFELMLLGDEAAKGFCMRAKIDFAHKNSTMRDPVMFRSNHTPHHRTGTEC
eukprot:GSMAST32.ASY1.ANO1.284.1 assembled CDS